MSVAPGVDVGIQSVKVSDSLIDRSRMLGCPLRSSSITWYQAPIWGSFVLQDNPRLWR